MIDNEALWKPHVTVAAVVEHNGKFLLVEEETASGARFNQPAGHLEPGETLAEAVVRETLEETARPFEPAALVGIYQYYYPVDDVTYLRFAFAGSVGTVDTSRTLDDGIIRAVWLTSDEIRANRARHRTPLVVQCMQDYLDGKRYPLGVIADGGAFRA